jgi:glycosyltransferase involved in cell wall biosynthesis
LGFSGENLPLIPNSGGFTSLDLSRELLHPRERKRIYLKGYGGLFGLIFEALIAVERILVEFPDHDLIITSVTSDAHKSVQNLWRKFPTRVRYFLLENPQPHEVIMQHLAQSAVFVGASKSDGISTSFLEALVSGCYAIQTNTSCASEWLDRGFIASEVATDSESMYLEIKKVIDDEDLRIRAFDTNVALAREQLAYNTIAQIAQGFYKD